MLLLSDPTEINRNFKENLKQCKNMYFAAAWAGRNFDIADILLGLASKVKIGVIGTDFYQTDPMFIRDCINHRQFKFMKQSKGVFHPKIYLFEMDNNRWKAIKGSTNFTKSAFSINKEAALYIESSEDLNEIIFIKLKDQIASYYKSMSAAYASDINLENYSYWHSRAKNHIEAARGTFLSSGSPNHPIDIDLLNMNWNDYYYKVKNDRNNSLLDRNIVLEEARKLFNIYKYFSDMPADSRKNIGGFKTSNDIKWKYFGSMQGAGYFKFVINRNSEKLATALDQISMSSNITKANYDNFIEQYIESFRDHGGMGHGVATATRLLALRRPDVFVCLDSRNRYGICKAFGIKISGNDYNAYWHSIIERICEARWWNSPRPVDPNERRVWDGRAAFLDSLFYEGAGE